MISIVDFYNVVAVLLSALLSWLVFTGPPLPAIYNDIYLPVQSLSPVLHLDNDSFIPFTTNVSVTWNALLPPNGGKVLATNLTTGYHYWANVAMFRHLRCLRDIRAQMVTMASSWQSGIEFREGQGVPGSDYEMAGQCFDHIRQALLCHADTTLHPMAQLSPETRIVDGNALWHMCKDPSLAYSWADMSGVPKADARIREGPDP